MASRRGGRATATRAVGGRPAVGVGSHAGRAARGPQAHRQRRRVFSFAFAQGAAQRACSQQPTRNSRGWLAGAGLPESVGGLKSTRRLTPMPIHRVNQCLNSIFIFKALCHCSATGMLPCGTCISMTSRPWFILFSGVTRRCLARDVGARGARALGSGSSWRAGEPHSAGARGAPAHPPPPPLFHAYSRPPERVYRARRVGPARPDPPRRAPARRRGWLGRPASHAPAAAPRERGTRVFFGAGDCGARASSGPAPAGRRAGARRGERGTRAVLGPPRRSGQRGCCSHRALCRSCPTPSLAL